MHPPIHPPILQAADAQHHLLHRQSMLLRACCEPVCAADRARLAQRGVGAAALSLGSKVCVAMLVSLTFLVACPWSCRPCTQSLHMSYMPNNTNGSMSIVQVC